MRFATSSVVVAIAALASSVQGRAAPATATTAAAAAAATNAPVSGAANAITFPLGDKPLEAGKSVTIKWTPNFGDKVTLSLRKGSDTDNLDNLVDIAVDVDNSGSLTWTPPASLKAGDDYAIEIVSGSSANYSPQFSVDSDGSGLSSTKSSANTATTDSSSTKTSSATKTTSTSTDDDVSSTASASKTKSASDEDASSEPTSSADASSDADASSTPTDTAAATDISAPEETGAADSGAVASIARSPLAFMVGLVAVLAFFH